MPPLNGRQQILHSCGTNGTTEHQGKLVPSSKWTVGTQLHGNHQEGKLLLAAAEQMVCKAHVCTSGSAHTRVSPAAAVSDASMQAPTRVSQHHALTLARGGLNGPMIRQSDAFTYIYAP
jgi:hypothetical protein